MKKIVTMQDISCVGKCSLTVALPVLSAMGIETAVIPTAVLSTHTMFQGFTFHDLTSEVNPILTHWQKEGFTSVSYTHLSSVTFATIVVSRFSMLASSWNFSASSFLTTTAIRSWDSLIASSCLLYTSRCV